MFFPSGPIPTGIGSSTRLGLSGSIAGTPCKEKGSMSAGISRVLVPLGRTKQYPTASSGTTISIRRAPACCPRGAVGIGPRPAPDATGDPTKLSPEADAELRGDTGAPRPNPKPAAVPAARQKPDWVVPEAPKLPKAEDPRAPAAVSLAAS